MVHRKLESVILEMLESFRIVAINGPRQSGKTTLQKKLAKNRGMKYYTFDELNVFNTALSDPKGFITYISKDENIKDNWDLSVLRATSIVRILLDGSGIDPDRITVAGRGEYLPIDPASTSEARRKNRRTEIILSPNLDELFRILDLE